MRRMKCKQNRSVNIAWHQWLAVLFLPALLWSSQLYSQTIDEVVLVVDDQAITAREFAVLRILVDPELPYALVRPELGDPVTDRIIDNVLLSVHAQRIAPDVQIPDSAVTASLINMAKGNNLTAQQFMAKLESQGVDIQILRSSIRQRLRVQQVLGERIARSIKVTEADVQAYINNRPELKAQTQKKFRASHLVITVEDGLGTADIKKLKRIASDVQARLAAGESFATVAADTPEVSVSGDNGDLGWKKQEELPELFVTVLNKLEPGQTSGVIESSNGFHVLRLDDVARADGGDQEYRVRHILKIVRPGDDPAAALARLQNIKLQILGGVDFARLAATESQDSGSAQQGGDLGWIELQQVDPAFAQAVASLKIGETSDPVRSKFGLHLIQVLQVRKRAGASLLEKQVEQQIFAQNLDEAMEDLLNDIKQIAVIEVVDQ